MQSVSALSSMHITADSVTHDTAMAQQLELVVDLASTIVTAKAAHIQYQTIEARNASCWAVAVSCVTLSAVMCRLLELVVDLASTTVTAKAAHIQYQTIEARNANILLDYRAVNNQSRILALSASIVWY